VLVAGLARWLEVPDPALLALAGAGLAFLPFAPAIEIEPDIANRPPWAGPSFLRRDKSSLPIASVYCHSELKPSGFSVIRFASAPNNL
jgi:hypothetical protein